MPYIEVPAVRAILTRDVLDTTGTAASVPESVIATAIEDASEEVDATLRSRYTVPFASPTPKLIAGITRDIAAWLTDLVYRQEKDYDSIDREPLLMRVTRARLLLTKLADGTFLLPPVVGGDDGGIGEATVINPYEPALFRMPRALVGCGSKGEFAEYGLEESDVYGPVRYGEYVAGKVGY